MADEVQWSNGSWPPLSLGQAAAGGRDERAFWRTGARNGGAAACSLAALLGAPRLGFLWLSGLPLRTYIPYGPDADQSQVDAYGQWCSEHLEGRLWAAAVTFPAGFSQAWVPPDYVAPGALGSVGLAEWPHVLAICVPGRCSANTVSGVIVPLHLLFQAIAVQMRSCVAEVVRGFAARLRLPSAAGKRDRARAAEVAAAALRRDVGRLRTGLQVRVRELMPTTSAEASLRHPAAGTLRHRCEAMLQPPSRLSSPKSLAAAVREQRRCTEASGRLWSLTPPVPPPPPRRGRGRNRQARRNRQRRGRGLHSARPIRRGYRGFGRLGVCAAAECSAHAVRTVLLQSLWSRPREAAAQQQQQQQQRSLLRMHERGPALEELAAWSDHRLDWAILGFEGCGTTTLAAALHLHPELEVLHADDLLEDGSYFLTGAAGSGGSRGAGGGGGGLGLLPSRLDTLRFNAWATKPPTVGSRRVRGIKRPQYVRSNGALARLGEVPGLRAVLLIDDPVALAERQYLKNAGRCQVENASFKIPPLAACLVRPCMPRCSGRRGDQRERPPFALDLTSFQMAGRVRRTLAVLGGPGARRLLLATRGDLKRGRVFYDAVAAFVGATRRFPAASDGPLSSLVLNEASGNAPAPTPGLQRELGLKNAAARRAHERALTRLRASFAGERKALCELFKQLLPPTAKSCPAWAQTADTAAYSID
eukprot:TRINITY_DN12153_c0_g1_i1.p1 TRINITY_DN12153_c0_g1~~TRINITY_DN12153_c0_g1_i1.p1  ORF type:complete len:703 (-),score=136.07 TRINITY_DN12153_c0_g1_i1:31-2139(-)